MSILSLIGSLVALALAGLAHARADKQKETIQFLIDENEAQKKREEARAAAHITLP